METYTLAKTAGHIRVKCPRAIVLDNDPVRLIMAHLGPEVDLEISAVVLIKFTLNDGTFKSDNISGKGAVNVLVITRDELAFYTCIFSICCWGWVIENIIILNFFLRNNIVFCSHGLL